MWSSSHNTARQKQENHEYPSALSSGTATQVQIRDVSGTDEAVPEANAFNYVRAFGLEHCCSCCGDASNLSAAAFRASEVQLPVKALPEHWRASSESLKKAEQLIAPQ